MSDRQGTTLGGLARPGLHRRGLLLGAAALALPGCRVLDGVSARDSAMRAFFGRAERLTMATQRALIGDSLAPEFAESDIRQAQRPNGSTLPGTAEYQALMAGGFGDYRLVVDGLVDRPLALSLPELQAMPARTQVTRHDCVEGWSTIAKWTGIPLAQVLNRAGLRANARYAIFHCMDDIERGLSGAVTYYESIDLIDAFHPQTILAFALNGQPLPVAYGAPLRLRVERQLGYKMAKYIRRIELAESFAGLGQGRGSYWADRGYEWYAGI